MNEQPDHRLVEAARSGDTESFGELYRRHYPTIVGVAYAVLADRHLAEDAAQEAFAIACRDLGRLRRTDKFTNWLWGICRNVARDLARAKRRHVRADSLPELIDKPSKDGLSAAVRESVQRLPLAAREIVMLRYFSNLSHAQIAETLGITRQAVHGRLVRARRRLAEDLRRSGLHGRES